MKQLAAILALLAGCSPAPSVSTLTYRAVGLDESQVPMIFALKLENTGQDVGKVDDVKAIILASRVIAPDASVPDDVQLQVAVYGFENPLGNLRQLADGEAVAIPPGKTGDVRCGLAWGLPANPPRMLALVSAEFAATFHGEELTRSTPRAFVLQSQAGVLERILAGPVNKDQAAAIIAAIEKMPGKPSASVQALRARMQSASE